ncbi:helix-turn-helix transcriptional regulator [Pyxidicoccus xibeiensis]|uniref:helix-turn-helix transcriptional regulator n=1 Tax=Pyxidicoccus xibeiensis TaxID=2906759 RepID=UPI0020A79FDD|nr:AraC family transcriptional regulator [Pyxidicoccus xibeiensis]MCP3141763.1 AraC family transcriptional regulator [Pyxidicoccus xibeiensis]
MSYGIAARPRFQEPATTAPVVFLSAVRSAYVGPSLRLAPHRNAVACVVLSLGEPFTLAAGGSPREARSALIPPNTLHQLTAGSGAIAFLYLDPLDVAVAGGPGWRQRTRSGVSLEHAGAEEAVAALLRLRAVKPAAAGRQVLDTLGGLVEPSGTRTDRRITSALRKLEPVVEGLDAAECRLDRVAAGLELSVSRAQHLIREVTGVPFRRYRTWVRMRVAARTLASGGTLTEAAHVAGFSSAAHFSTAFRTMFGLPPSALVSAGTCFVVLPA